MTGDRNYVSVSLVLTTDRVEGRRWLKNSGWAPDVRRGVVVVEVVSESVSGMVCTASSLSGSSGTTVTYRRRRNVCTNDVSCSGSLQEMEITLD